MIKEGWTEALSKLDCCYEALEWAEQFETFESAWNACTRGDWMLWLVGTLGIDHKRLVLAACDCADLAQQSPEGEAALNAARAWAGAGGGGPLLAAVAHAASVACDAAQDAAHDFDAHAAEAAACAADVVYVDALSAATAATAVTEAVRAIAFRAGNAATYNAMTACAEIVRSYFTVSEITLGERP